MQPQYDHLQKSHLYLILFALGTTQLIIAATFFTPINALLPGITTTTRLDLHSLRHTFITWCAQKFRVEITQKLARHSTSVLTLDYYTHAANDDIHAAVATLENELLGCVKGCVNRSKKRAKPKKPKKKYSKNPQKTA